MDVLKDKSQKRYSNISRYTPFSYYYHTVDDKYIYGTTSHLNRDIVFLAHKVEESDTLESLALKYYGRPDYYWIIADFNGIVDPYKNLYNKFGKKGKSLRIPTLSDITFKVI